MPNLLKTAFFLFILLFPPKTYAIVVLPAVILIPLAKLVAVIVASFSIPIASCAAIIAKVTKQYTLTAILSLLTILFITIAAAISLRLQNPNNPWF